MTIARRTLLALAVTATLAGCVAYYPTYPTTAPGPPKYDQAFDAALNAATDSGVNVTTADRATGRIIGSKGGAGVTITLQQQGDGSVRVAFNAPDSKQTNPTLAEQLNGAYQRRMGR